MPPVSSCLSDCVLFSSTAGTRGSGSDGKGGHHWDYRISLFGFYVLFRDDMRYVHVTEPNDISTEERDVLSDHIEGISTEYVN